MFSVFRYIRRLFGRRSLSWLVGCVVAAGSLSSTARASILLPDAPSFTLEEHAKVGLAGDAPGSGAAPTQSPVQDSRDQESKQLLMQFAFFPGGPTSGSTSPAPGSGVGATGASALNSDATILQADLAFAGWVTGARRVSLPTPPGNDLLRPPQAA